MANRNIVMLAENNKINKIMLKELIKGSYHAMEVSGIEEAKSKFSVFRRQICCIIYNSELDMNGAGEFLKYFSEIGAIEETPVFVTVYESSADFQKYYDMGASEVIKLPFDPYFVKSRIDYFARFYNQKMNYCDELDKTKKALENRETVVQNILSTVFEFIHFESPSHITRIKRLTGIIAKQFAADNPEYQLNENDIDLISKAAALHDVGKASVPTNILFKPGRLTPEEFDEMKSHTVKGEEILSDFGIEKNASLFYRYCYEICRNHHERWDGNGYPDKLAEDDIPVSAQIVSIIDVYDAMVSEKVYKDAIPYEKAVTMIRDGECGMFPPKVLDAFNAAEPEMRSYLKAALMLKDEQI